jgi:tetratricopeptide (TPR) repeat protein
VQAELGKYNEAIADYTKAIELNPGFNLAVKNQIFFYSTPESIYWVGA